MAKSACLTLALALMQVSLVLCTLPTDYESKTKEQKRDILWNQITWGDLYPGADGKYPTGDFGLQEFLALKPTFLTTAFNRVSDEMEAGRPKLFHTYGTCAKAKIVSELGHNYTGLFEAGTTTIGIYRPSLGKIYDTKWLPGAGFKCLIDGKPSVNYHTLFSLDGQEEGNYNFFASTVSNVIPGATTFKLKTAEKVFQTALWLLGFPSNQPENPNTMTLYEHASIKHDGTLIPEGSRAAPWRINFVPTQAVQQDATVKEDFRKKISTIPAGTQVYDLIAFRTKADAEANINSVKIATLTTESEFVASKYCDEGIYMKHSVKRWKQN